MPTFWSRSWEEALLSNYILLVSRVATPGADTALPAAEQAKFDTLLSNFNQLATEIATSSVNTSTSQSATVATAVRGYYRVTRATVDADADGVADWQEAAWSQDDYDGDGWLNYQEMAMDLPIFEVQPSALNPMTGTVTIPETVGNQTVNRTYSAMTFRARRGIAHGYGYRIQETQDVPSVAASVWNDLNLYTHKVESVPVPGSHVDKITIRASVPHTTAPVRSLRVFLTAPGFGQTLMTQVITPQNLKAHNDACISSLIGNPLSTEDPNQSHWRRIFDYYDRESECTWARWTWASKLDFSGVAWDNYRHGWNQEQSGCEGTLISPQHILMAAHYTYAWNSAYERRPGSKIVFHRRNGERIVRTIIKIAGKTNADAPHPHPQNTVVIADGMATHPWPVSLPPNPPTPDLQSDMAIGLLDTPVPPDVPFYRVLPSGHSSMGTDTWASLLNQALLVSTDRERSATAYKIRFNPYATPIYPAGEFVHKIIDSGAVGATNANFRIPARDGAIANVNVDGDSSNPWFLLVKGELILLGVLESGGSGWVPFISHPLNFPVANELLQSLTPNQSLTEFTF